MQSASCLASFSRSSADRFPLGHHMAPVAYSLFSSSGSSYLGNFLDHHAENVPLPDAQLVACRGWIAKLIPTKRELKHGLVVRDGSGQVILSKLKSDKKKRGAFGSATYIYRGAVVSLVGCDISGFYGIRAIERSKVLATNCDISASGACFAMVDQNSPMEASIIAEGCKTTGKKVELQDGASFEEI